MSALLELAAVAKSYVTGDSRVDALKAIDLKIEAGEFVALQGPSGSGKSTLLNICGLVDSADSGDYRLSGDSMIGLSSQQLSRTRRESIGFIFQGFNLIPVMSVFENIEYPLLLSGRSAAERKQQVQALVHAVGLDKFQHHRPDHISGGQRQRVAVARALVKLPKLVIADEPTANLDTHTAELIIDLMHSMAQRFDTTFLIATHDERMAQRCDRVVQLQDGVLQ